MYKGLIVALIGGLLGAALWAAIAFFAHAELGILAWGIGVAVGGGMYLGARDEANGISGIVCCIIALGAIALGKFGAVHFAVAQVVKEHPVAITLDDAKIEFADQIVEEYEANGKALKWPDGISVENAQRPEDYPKDLWKDVEKRWATLTPEEQESRRANIELHAKAAMKMAASGATQQAFIASFDFLDILWAGLAVFSAYRLGSGGD